MFVSVLQLLRPFLFLFRNFFSLTVHDVVQPRRTTQMVLFMRSALIFFSQIFSCFT